MVINYLIKDLYVIGVYCFKNKVNIVKFVDVLKYFYDIKLVKVVFIFVFGDFNVNLFEEILEKKVFLKYLIE